MFAGLVMRDSGIPEGWNAIVDNYKQYQRQRRLANTRALPQLTGSLIVKLGGGSMNPDTNLAPNVPPPITLGGLGRDMRVLRLEPAPERLPTQLTSDGRSSNIMYAARPAGNSRQPSEFSMALEFSPDSVLTPQMLSGGQALEPGWLVSYILFLESLTHPLFSFGRKTYLSLLFGQEWFGVGQYALCLEAVEADREWWGTGGHLERVNLTLRLKEYLYI